MTYAATYPLAAERASVFPQQPGFIGPKAAVPEFRWAPPAGFATTYPVSMSPSGLFPYGPAYASPPQTGCPSCLRGLGSEYSEAVDHMEQMREAQSRDWDRTQSFAAQFLQDQKEETGTHYLGSLAMFYATLPIVRPPTEAEKALGDRASYLVYQNSPARKDLNAWKSEVTAMARETVNTPNPVKEQSALQSKGLFILAAAAGVLLLGLYLAEQKAPRRKR